MNALATNPRLGRNAVWSLTGEIFSRLIAFAVIVWLTNYLGTDQWGTLNYPFAMANLLVIVADFGLSTYLIKELAPRLENANRTLPTIIGLKLVMMAISFGLMVFVGFLIPNVSWQLMTLGGLAILLSNARMFVEAIFRAWQRLDKETITKNIAAVLLVVCLAIAIMWRASLVQIAFAYAVAASIGLLFAWLLFKKKTSGWRIAFPCRDWKIILQAAWPFALATAFNYVFNYMDTAMLGLFGQTAAVGWYSAAYKIIFFLTALAGMVINAFFPVIAAEYHSDRTRAEETIRLLFRVLTMAAIPLAIGGTLLGPAIIELLYTPEYEPASLAFQILIWGTAGIYVWAAFGNSLQAIGGEKIYVRGFGWGALLNTVLNLALIPQFSLYGAAAATVLTQLFLIAYMYIHLRHYMKLDAWRYAWRPLLAGIGMALVLWSWRLPLGWAIGLGIMVYLPLLFALRGIGKNEFAFIRSIWKKTN